MRSSCRTNGLIFRLKRILNEFRFSILLWWNLLELRTKVFLVFAIVSSIRIALCFEEVAISRSFVSEDPRCIEETR
ncbi:hypothetical protein [Leptospira ellisii]|uniref:Uncharacterized protein n=1 Tax=Leptospira ellisii TaxID=2023197 RepID=A0A2N0B5K9_9LEPT|nr:hypothetical protein [Leptospira ellisii]PJZ91835.1 hypothetical protein CH379_16480 [Leptospira ellisii]PKA04596.1 hypothetical protein CH375_10000 [Leptospira ellisii]